MIVYRYDKTFEGLLTAVFDSYARRNGACGGILPDALLAEGEPAPLFTIEDHTVVTDPQKSGRVWRGLSTRLPKEVCNMLMMAWLSEEPGVDMMLARYMCRVFGERTGVATDFSDPDVLRVRQLAQKVSREREHLMQFTRFQKGGDGTYFAPVSPIYNALPLAVSWFRDRFRDQRWLLYDIRRRYGFYYDLETLTEVTMEDDAHLLGGRLDEALAAADERLFQELWRTYFHAMPIAERINPRLQRQHMPRRFWALLTEMQ